MIGHGPQCGHPTGESSLHHTFSLLNFSRLRSSLHSTYQAYLIIPLPTTDTRITVATTESISYEPPSPPLPARTSKSATVGRLDTSTTCDTGVGLLRRDPAIDLLHRSTRARRSSSSVTSTAICCPSHPTITCASTISPPPFPLCDPPPIVSAYTSHRPATCPAGA